MEAGKHVICEKPLTGYFGRPGQENIGVTVPKSEMLSQCLAEMDRLKEVVEKTGKEVHVCRKLRLCHTGAEGR